MPAISPPHKSGVLGGIAGIPDAKVAGGIGDGEGEGRILESE